MFVVYHAKALEHGWASFMNSSQLSNPNNGYIYNDTVVMQANVSIIEEEFSVDDKGKSEQPAGPKPPPSPDRLLPTLP